MDFQPQKATLAYYKQWGKNAFSGVFIRTPVSNGRMPLLRLSEEISTNFSDVCLKWQEILPWDA